MMPSYEMENGGMPGKVFGLGARLQRGLTGVKAVRFVAVGALVAFSVGAGFEPLSSAQAATVEDRLLMQSVQKRLGDTATAPRQVAQYDGDDSYRAPPEPPPPPSGDGYRNEGYGSGSVYNRGPPVRDNRGTGTGSDAYQAPDSDGYARRDGGNYDRGYQSPPPYDENYGERYERGPDGSVYADRGNGTYSKNEILDAGHGFFGSLSKGLAGIIEYAFQKSGRPNGYILGEDAGGAFVAGLRYGEGQLYTRDAGSHKVYWQGPSVGYDFGAEGSKTMILVYNMRSPSQIFHRFGGVQGSAYLIGGVSIQFQKHGDVVLAPIRTGVGLRLGANVGYLKYTRRPTWNPF